MGKKNLKCSAILQALLDLETACVDENANVELATVKQLKDLVSKNKSLINATDEIIKHHKYPDSKLSFYKDFNSWCVNKKYNAIDISHLSHDAIALLQLFKDNMSQENLVAISNDAAVENGYRPGRSLTKAINELIENGCITVFYNHSKSSPTIYAVSSELAHYDNYNNIDLFVIEIDEDNPEEMRMGPGHTKLGDFAVSIPRNTKRILNFDGFDHKYNLILSDEEIEGNGQCTDK